MRFNQVTVNYMLEKSDEKSDGSEYDIKYMINYSKFVGNLDIILNISQIEYKDRRVTLNRYYSDPVSINKIDRLCQHILELLPDISPTMYTIHWNLDTVYNHEWVRFQHDSTILNVQSVECSNVDGSWMALITVGV